jgi:hypothetical protein
VPGKSAILSRARRQAVEFDRIDAVYARMVGKAENRMRPFNAPGGAIATAGSHRGPRMHLPKLLNHSPKTPGWFSEGFSA